jgi:hypothetical protein
MTGTAVPRMTTAARRRAAALAALALFAVGLIGPADAVRRRDQDPIHGAPEEEPFREADIAPPPYPADAGLIEFTTTGRTRNRFYVDGPSLSVGPDKVIRFVLVVRTPSKVNNVSFSAVRCGTQEWKDYAYARTDKTWVRDEQAKWRPIEARGFNNHQHTLFSEFFCYGGVASGGPLGSAESIVRNLKHPTPADPHSPRKFNQFQQR